jgi:hypothetical protein
MQGGNEAVKQGDEAYNASSLQFFMRIKRSSLQFFVCLTFISIIFFNVII